jgi:hypothetical protein
MLFGLFQLGGLAAATTGILLYLCRTGTVWSRPACSETTLWPRQSPKPQQVS